MKKILLSILAIVCLLIIVSFFAGKRLINNFLFKERPYYTSFEADFQPFPFVWVENTYGDYLETQDAIYIPISLEGIPNPVSFQFDTGAPYSLIYENTLVALKEQGFVYTIVTKDEKRFVEELRFELAGNPVKASMLEIREGHRKAYEQGDTISHIKLGTIGADFLDQRITEIDFKNQLIQWHPKRADWMTQNSPFQAFDFRGKRVILPAKINKRSLEMLYDSGSSAFGLITNKGEYKQYANANAQEIFLDGNSWGNSIPIRHIASDQMIVIGGAEVSLKRVSYVDMYANFQGLMRPLTSIGGWLGNKPFLEHSLILDTKKEEFVVVGKE